MGEVHKVNASNFINVKVYFRIIDQRFFVAKPDDIDIHGVKLPLKQFH